MGLLQKVKSWLTETSGEQNKRQSLEAYNAAHESFMSQIEAIGDRLVKTRVRVKTGDGCKKSANAT